jgi:tetratricopeptide (TPR) repeat protein
VNRLLDEIGEDVSAPVLAPLYVALAHLYFASGRYLAQMEAAERAVAYAREAGDVRSQAAATVRLGTAYGMIGRYEEAVTIVRDAVPLAEQSGDLDILALTLNNLAEFLRGLGNPRGAMPYRDQALDAVKRIGDVAGLAYSFGMSGWSHFEIGDVVQAAEYLEEAVRIAQVYPDSWRTPYAYAHCGRWLVFTGDHERAGLYLRRAISMAERGDDLQAKTYATISLALLELLREQPESAEQLLHPLLDVSIWLAPEILCTSAEAQLELGHSDLALELADRALTTARNGHNRFYEAHTQRTRGRILAATGPWEDAVSALEEAVAEFRRMEMLLELALSLYELGLLKAGNGALRGRDHLDEALKIFRGLNARPFIERAERALAR